VLTFNCSYKSISLAKFFLTVQQSVAEKGAWSIFPIVR